MEDNKIMTAEENYEMEPVQETEEATENSFGVGVLVGGLLALAGIAIAKKVRQVWQNHKDKEPTVPKTDANVIDITPDPVDSDEETE